MGSIPTGNAKFNPSVQRAGGVLHTRDCVRFNSSRWDQRKWKGERLMRISADTVRVLMACGDRDAFILADSSNAEGGVYTRYFWSRTWGYDTYRMDWTGVPN